MLGPPVVVSGGCPVGGTFDVAVVGLPVLAWAIATPPVSPVLVHLVVESVVHLGERACSVLTRHVNKFKKIDKQPLLSKGPRFCELSAVTLWGKQRLR